MRMTGCRSVISEPSAAGTLRRKGIGAAAATGGLRGCCLSRAAECRDDRHAFMDVLAFDGGLLTICDADANAEHGDLACAVRRPEKGGTRTTGRELLASGRVSASGGITTDPIPIPIRHRVHAGFRLHRIR